jgi:hypothetical protein
MPNVSNFMSEANKVKSRILRVSECRVKIYFGYAEREQNHERSE